MIKIKISDNLFSHALYSTDYQKSKYIIWDRTNINGNENFVFYTDNSLNNVNNNINNKIAWLLESPEVSKQQHEWIKKNYNKFDIIFTNNKDLLDINDKFKFAPTGGCWIEPVDQKIHTKNKLLSIISSNKNWTSGHKTRLNIIKELHGFDIYGRGYNEIPYKLDGLKDYMFSIVVENSKKDYYFTEKIIDCFMTGTIPIYWGCPSIGDFFDINGIITFNTINELKQIIKNLNIELYNSKINNIINNLNIGQKYLISEDYIFENYFKK